MNGEDSLNSQGTTKLWKRAWRTKYGTVHTTRAYSSKEELLANEPKSNGGNGNKWLGQPFSYEAEIESINEYSLYNAKQ